MVQRTEHRQGSSSCLRFFVRDGPEPCPCQGPGVPAPATDKGQGEPRVQENPLVVISGGTRGSPLQGEPAHVYTLAKVIDGDHLATKGDSSGSGA